MVTPAEVPDVQEALRVHGALLFRGFDISTPQEFERLARSIDDDLKNEYLGTSPRNALTEYVFTASELPGSYPIPQHCEMSFCAHPPRRVFFWCQQPARSGGETPLVDFAAVWRDLDPAVRQRFETRGLRVVRTYSGSRRDPLQLKRWDEMFRTRDRARVEAMARREGFEPRWGPGDRLTLVSRHEAGRRHPDSGEMVWFNHAQAFHLSAGPGELRRIFRLRPGLRSLALWALSSALVAWSRLRRGPEEHAMHCTWADGTEIPDADMEAVRDAIWRHLVIIPWQQGDVMAIDNQRIGHGRLPYRGPRRVAICWA